MDHDKIRHQIIEKICRHICKLKNIDPDRIYSPQIPEFIDNNKCIIAGFYIPNMQAPVWTSFIPLASIAVDAVGSEYYLKAK
jgi:hypothetical protein